MEQAKVTKQIKASCVYFIFCSGEVRHIIQQIPEREQGSTATEIILLCKQPKKFRLCPSPSRQCCPHKPPFQLPSARLQGFPRCRQVHAGTTSAEGCSVPPLGGLAARASTEGCSAPETCRTAPAHGCLPH